MPERGRHLPVGQAVGSLSPACVLRDRYQRGDSGTEAIDGGTAQCRSRRQVSDILETGEDVSSRRAHRAMSTDLGRHTTPTSDRSPMPSHAHFPRGPYCDRANKRSIAPHARTISLRLLPNVVAKAGCCCSTKPNGWLQNELGEATGSNERVRDQTRFGSPVVRMITPPAYVIPCTTAMTPPRIPSQKAYEMLPPRSMRAG
jgi:hypothetical protein